MFQGLKLAKVHIMQNSVHKYYTYVFLTCLSELDTSTAFLCTMFHPLALLRYPSQCLSYAGDNTHTDGPAILDPLALWNIRIG